MCKSMVQWTFSPLLDSSTVLTIFFPLVSSQKYLREFFSVMLQSSTSPLHINKVGLTLSKHTICEFSPFFKKGVFDYSSHGTG